MSNSDQKEDTRGDGGQPQACRPTGSTAPSAGGNSNDRKPWTVLWSNSPVHTVASVEGEHICDALLPHARFIVRACNSHDELLDALQELEWILLSGLHGDMQVVSPALRRTYDVIANAEGRDQ